jgi:ribosomal protein S6--L-glutamate ligase
MAGILVISKKRSYFSTSEIIKSLDKHGAEPKFIKTDNVRLCAAGDEASLTYRREKLTDVGSIIPRIGRSLTSFGYSMIRHFEIVGTPTTLSSFGLMHARNKFLAMQSLVGSGIPFPETWLAGSKMEFGEIKEKLDFPIIIKLLSGTQGIGVMRINNEKDAIPIIDTMDELNQLVLIQQYLENNDEDIRAFIVDGRVVAAMRRVSPEYDWRANIHAGGKGIAYKLTDEEEEMTLKATECLDLGVAGVDLIQTPNGPRLIEANVSPGFKGLLAATGVNAADSIAEYAIQLSKK